MLPPSSPGSLHSFCSRVRGLVPWGSAEFLPVKQRQNAGAGQPWVVLLPVSCAFATQNSRLASWAFQFHGKQSRFTFWSQRKRKKVWTCGGEKLLDEKNNYGLKFHVSFQGKEISYLR